MGASNHNIIIYNNTIYINVCLFNIYYIYLYQTLILILKLYIDLFILHMELLKIYNVYLLYIKLNI